jgi:hypothetical protein
MQNPIRGLVFSKYHSISEFGKAIKWGRQKASRIVNGSQKPTADDMEQMAEHFDIHDALTFVSIFFPHIATK